MIRDMFRPLWIEINLRALRNNYRKIRKLLHKETKIIATVKQFAYGHGLIPLADELSYLGVDFFGTGSLEEAISLREAGFKEPIIVLSAVLDKFSEYFLRYTIRPTIVNLEFARKLSREAQKRKTVAPVHIKIDTGMGRLGYYYKDARGLVRKIHKLKNIFLEGIYTHFPAADTDPEFTNYQIGIFNKFISQLAREGIYFKFHHCSNSAGIVNYPHAHFNMVRPGIILYGIRPQASIHFDIKPLLSLKSKVIFFKKVNKGMGVSYGRSYIARKPTTIATIAAGYADGYPLSLSGCGKVIIKDAIFNIAGRVCMDHIMADLKGREDISAGEEVVLIGRKKNLVLTVEDLAKWAGTIPYEIVSRLSLKIPRIYKYPHRKN